MTVVGPSGCGKSTLLRIASGSTPTPGHRARRPRAPGYVFQDATLLPWRTVRRNVELFAELRRHGRRPSAGPRRRERSSSSGSTGFEDKYPKQLSGGMRMRASLARSLVMDPDVFLFDEPFGALDEITRERLNDELLSLFQREGFAGLFITHSIYEAVFLSTRVLVMSARPGRIVGDFDVPFAYPRSPELRFDAELRRAGGRGLATPCGERTHERRRTDAGSGSTAASTPRRRRAPPTGRRRPATSAARPGVVLTSRRLPIAVVFGLVGVWYFMHYVGLEHDLRQAELPRAAAARRRQRRFFDCDDSQARLLEALWLAARVALVGLADLDRARHGAGHR